jgi:uncharacterized protein
MPATVVQPGQTHTVLLDPGQRLRCVNLKGSQVVDLWAFAAEAPSEYMSMAHSRLHMGRISPTVGSVLVTNRRRPILSLTADTSAGAHDTLLAACDPERYVLLGCQEPHANCADNFRAAMRAAGRPMTFVPDPLNLFEQAPVAADGALEIRPPVSPPGAYVDLRAEIAALVVASVCPQDIAPTNGADCTPQPVAFEILPEAGPG